MTPMGLIFDCDGVLADTEHDGHLPAFNRAFADAGLPVAWGADEYRRLLEISGGNERLRTLFGAEGALRGTPWDGDRQQVNELIAALHRRKTAYYVQAIQGGALPGRPGIRRLAQEAAQSGWTLAVASTSVEKSVRAVLTHVVGVELADRFDIYSGDIVSNKKPAPDIYLAAMAGSQFDPSRTIVIEDSGIGCRAALAAGLRCVITTSTYTERDDFSGASLIVSSLGEPSGPVARLISSPKGLNIGSFVTLEDLRILSAQPAVTTTKEPNQ